MTSVEEFVAAIRSSLEVLRQAQAGVDGSRQQAEELTTGFQMLGVESYAVTAYGWQEDVQQARAMVEELIGRLEQLITTAEGLRSQGTAARAPSPRPSPTPLDAAPTNLKEPVAKVGDAVTAPEPGPGSYQQELDASDENDKKMSKFRRAARRTVRNAESLQEQAKDSFSVRLNAPEDYETHVSVADPHEPVVRGVSDTPEPQDIVSNSVLMVATAFEGLSRLWARRRSENQ